MTQTWLLKLSNRTNSFSLISLLNEAISQTHLLWQTYDDSVKAQHTHTHTHDSIKWMNNCQKTNRPAFLISSHWKEAKAFYTTNIAKFTYFLLMPHVFKCHFTDGSSVGNFCTLKLNIRSKVMFTNNKKKSLKKMVLLCEFSTNCHFILINNTPVSLNAFIIIEGNAITI